MDATTRWETEAIRSSARGRSGPPRPTAKRGPSARRKGSWLTLKDAEAATGIPVNTLRKWVRKSAIDSYLESDGELAVRMVSLEAIEERAAELGRELHPQQRPSPQAAAQAASPPAVDDEPATEPELPGVTKPKPQTEDLPDGTMLVPIDAWNKMLNQLGNLHEAGQMLADARERAAKAETEAQFLRERLAEIREAASEPQQSASDGTDSVADDRAADRADAVAEPEAPDRHPTTTYWRYLTTGWRDRKRRAR